ncbi:sugar ABC transporter ATP-binding protein [Atrimonas thermophila]|uniref:sugar ABC transporter ATP-binding protein n=1 Tax=Atrimonas thermophila TaxID=3064161 RepID=UPI00399D1672
MNKEILRMENISKSFPGVKALDGVTFSLQESEVHALVGENGAGKSTLMKILSGALQPDEGTIVLKGEKTHILSTHDAWEKGIGIIYQELNLIPELSVFYNIFLGREATKRGRTLDIEKMRNEAFLLLQRVGARISPDVLVGELSVAQQQMVEIAKALSLNASVLIMDEPTASLSENEVKKLFEIIRELKRNGVAIVYISHRLEEVFEIADRVTVLKDGKCMGTFDISELDKDKLISLMVGRSLSETFPPKSKKAGSPVIEVHNLRLGSILKDISFHVNSGEIVGLFGLVGSGRTELAKALFGSYGSYEGEIFIKGKKVEIRSPRQAIRSGLGFAPEDRKSEGLCLGLSVFDNCLFPIIDGLRKRFFIDFRRAMELVQHFVENLKIKTPHIKQSVRNLSGGNQQKVVLAKWLSVNPDFIIFDEPTRGIDVGAKSEIYHLMRDIAESGKGVLMISSELPEIIGMSDRLYIMYGGRIVKEISDPEEMTEENIMYFAAGLKEKTA